MDAILLSPLLDDLRSEPRCQKIVRGIEARREEARERVRRLGLDLYPPGAAPDSVGQADGIL